MKKRLQNLHEWHTVFAWFPVTTSDGLRVWLEHVERRYRFSSWWEDYFEFRLPATTPSDPVVQEKSE